jgi:acyl-CoA thioesterase I
VVGSVSKYKSLFDTGYPSPCVYIPQFSVLLKEKKLHNNQGDQIQNCNRILYFSFLVSTYIHLFGICLHLMFSIIKQYLKPIFFLPFVLISAGCTDDDSQQEIEPQLEPKTLQIMTLGNSITQGGETHPSYRYELWKMLVDADLDFEFVGSMDTNWYRNAPDTEHGADVASPVMGQEYKGKTFTNKHEGHWGWMTQEILTGKENPTSYKRDKGKLSDWLKGYTPDVVLMHLGTNDIIYSKGIDKTLERIELIVNQLRADNDEVVILMAKITPIPATYANVDSTQRFVSLIPQLASKLSNPKSPVIVVDINSGYNPGTHTYDALHPNQAGEKFIAKRWFDAIMANKEMLYSSSQQQILKRAFATNLMQTSKVPSTIKAKRRVD